MRGSCPSSEEREPGPFGCSSVRSQRAFATALDRHTKRLADRFPGAGRGNWGAARKSLNIFLRDVLSCRPLCDYFQLAEIEPWLELPLDSNAYSGLKADASHFTKVPHWPGVKHLDSDSNAHLQGLASAVADFLSVPRVHLDVRYWRRDELAAIAG